MLDCSGDFVVEIFGSLRFFFDYFIRGKRSTYSEKENVDFGVAFGVGPGMGPVYGTKLSKTKTGSTPKVAVARGPSFEEGIRLAPYAYDDTPAVHNPKKDSLPPDQYGYAQ